MTMREIDLIRFDVMYMKKNDLLVEGVWAASAIDAAKVLHTRSHPDTILDVHKAKKV